MRIHFKSLTLPKASAKRVQKYYGPNARLDDTPFPLSKAQEITALMLGYNDWYSLGLVTKKQLFEEPSLKDEECTAAEQKARIDYQVSVLSRFSPVIPSVIRQTVLTLRVSSGNPNDPRLIENAKCQNIMRPGTGQFESPWRFFASERTRDRYNDVISIQDKYLDGEINIREAVELLLKELSKFPENIYAIELFLYITGSVPLSKFFVKEINSIHKLIMSTFPDDYPKNKNGQLNYYEGDTRQFCRSIFNLAVNYYALKDYNKAKKLFNLTKRLCPQLRESTMPFLTDLRRVSPIGDVEIEEMF